MAIVCDASHGQCTGKRRDGRIKKDIEASQGGILPKDVSECHEGVPSVSLAWLVERGSGDGVLTVCSAYIAASSQVLKRPSLMKFCTMDTICGSRYSLAHLANAIFFSASSWSRLLILCRVRTSQTKKMPTPM